MKAPPGRVSTALGALALAAVMSGCGSNAPPAGPGDGAAGGGGGLPTMATDVCRAAIDAICEYLQVCAGEPIELCLPNKNLCPDHYFNPDTFRTVADVAACVAKLRARTCTDFIMGVYPACLAAGMRPQGAPCAFSSQCQSNVCTAGDECGTCLAGGRKRGESCDGSRCVSGLYCNGVTKLCADAREIIYAKEGEPCDAQANPPIGCVGDLFCPTDTSGRTVGVCTAPPGAGRLCAQLSFIETICARGSVCSAPGDGTCLKVGACGNALTCDGSTYCNKQNASCEPRAEIGETCDPAGLEHPLCLSPAVCSAPTNKCVVPRRNGESCDAPNGCDAQLTCTTGKCQPTVGVQTCP